MTENFFVSPEINSLMTVCSPDGVMILKNWKVFSFSSSIADMYDFDEDEFSGFDFGDLFFWELMDFRLSGLKSRFNQNGRILLGIDAVGLRRGQNTFPAVINISGFGDSEDFAVCMIKDKSIELRNEKRLLEEKRALDGSLQIQNRKIDDLNAKLENSIENTKTIERRSEIYSKIVSYINAVWDLDILLSGYLDLLSVVDISYISSIYIYNESTDIFKLRAYNGLRDQPEEFIKGSDGILGQIKKHRRTIQTKYLDDESSFVLWTPLGPWTPGSVLSFPIEYRGDFLGVISLALGHTAQLEELKFLETLITHLGIGINNLNQYTSLKELAEKLHHQTIEIEGKNKLLEQSSRMKSVFLANMSHEFKTPLNSIIGFSEILRDGVIGALSEKQIEITSDIYTAGIHLLTLVNDLIALSKIEGGKLELEVSLFHFQSSMRGEFQVWEERSQRHSQTMVINQPVKPLFLRADEIKIRQIISGLLSNAVKFSRKGGKITIDISEENYCFVFTVRDEGIGIDQKNFSMIFDPFQQVTNGETLPSGGAGLGLTLTKKFVELHKGNIELESELGKGSLFKVTIPDIIVESDPGSV
ncbi:MAG: hypothetical protein JXR95_12830 [Deltaproteobacteria bacterium]|nr:hypothetical protein [Deltaproteobacteria bacterium]